MERYYAVQVYVRDPKIGNYEDWWFIKATSEADARSQARGLISKEENITVGVALLDTVNFPA